MARYRRSGRCSEHLSVPPNRTRIGIDGWVISSDDAGRRRARSAVEVAANVGSDARYVLSERWPENVHVDAPVLVRQEIPQRNSPPYLCCSKYGFRRCSEPAHSFTNDQRAVDGRLLAGAVGLKCLPANSDVPLDTFRRIESVLPALNVGRTQRDKLTGARRRPRPPHAARQSSRRQSRDGLVRRAAPRVRLACRLCRSSWCPWGP